MPVLGYLGYLFALPFLLALYALFVCVRNPRSLAVLLLTALLGFVLGPLARPSARSPHSHRVSDFLGDKGLAGLDRNSAAVREFEHMPVSEDSGLDSAALLLEPVGNFIVRYQPLCILFSVLGPAAVAVFGKCAVFKSAWRKPT